MCVRALGRCVSTEVTVFSLHIFTRNNITPTLKKETHIVHVQHTNTHPDALPHLFILYLDHEIPAASAAQSHDA